MRLNHSALQLHNHHLTEGVIGGDRFLKGEHDEVVELVERTLDDHDVLTNAVDSKIAQTNADRLNRPSFSIDFCVVATETEKFFAARLTSFPAGIIGDLSLGLASAPYAPTGAPAPEYGRNID